MDSLYLFVFTQIASTEGFLIAAIVILAYLLLKRRRTEGRIFFLATIGLMLSTAVLKNLFQAARPPNALIETVGYAFPSGHAAGSLYLALCVWYLTRNTKDGVRYCVWAGVLAFALLIGISRVHLGVHTPLQVGAGYILGFLWALGYIVLARRTVLNTQS